MFADQLSPLVGEDDVVWVHDYHLMLLGQELRARGHRNRIGFFLHTPCGPPDILQTLPLHEQIFGSLIHYDLVGFQTANDRDNFARYLVARGASANRAGAYEIEGRQVKLGVFGVSIETKTYMRLARNAGRSAMVALVKESLSDNKLVLGVDRLDYTKGIPDRIKAIERFLEDYPEWRGKVTFLQITPKSRSDVKEYGEIESEVTGLIGRVNGKFGDAAWTPIRYVNRSYSRTVLAGFYRAADVALVTPLRDGMNLVAKEYLAAQDPENPGVLVLSEFAGAARELEQALIVNPHETDAVASALKRALEMPVDERRERHAPMLAHLQANDITKWAEDYLSAPRRRPPDPAPARQPARLLRHPAGPGADRVALGPVCVRSGGGEMPLPLLLRNLRSPRGRASDLELDADLHHLGARQLEIGVGALGVAVHEGEDRLAPARHPGTLAERQDRLVAGEVDRSAEIEPRNLPARHCLFETLRNVGLLHEAEAQFGPREPVADQEARIRSSSGRVRRLGRLHGDQQHLLVHGPVEVDVLRQRDRHALGHAAHDDGGPAECGPAG